MRAAAGVMDERFEEFGELFGRKYGRIMCDHVEDADTVVLCMGSMSGTVKHVVKEMRAAGRKVGICRVVAFRPFPAKEVASTQGAKNIAVIDRVSAMGSFGPLYEEVLAAMNYGGIRQTHTASSPASADATSGNRPSRTSSTRQRSWAQSRPPARRRSGSISRKRSSVQCLNLIS